MKTNKLVISTLAAALLWGATLASAHAAPRGAVLSPSDLEASYRTVLVERIGKARAERPAAFRNVDDVLSAVPELDRRKRGRFATISRELAALGPDALMPMLERLAVDGPARGKLTDTAWLTLRMGLIEAVGMRRDPVAVPVLWKIYEQESDYYVVRSAAEALGRIGTDDAAAALIKLARTRGPKQLAVLSAIGDCRRTVVARGLEEFLRSSPEYEATRLAIRALGDVGNSWAWETPAVKKTGEGAVVRSTAAKALVDAFARHHRDEVLRIAAQKALLVVADPATPGMIEAAKSGADPRLAARLDQLKLKFVSYTTRK